MSIAQLRAGYRDGSLHPHHVVARAYEGARGAGPPAWISLVQWSAIQRWLAALPPLPTDGLPLYGVPFAVKDNIDIADTPTTAGCPVASYLPRRSAFVVQRLIAAGAIPIGKTNMDQFATGLTGTRTPHGACASVVDGRYISGGSSSGSAVVVADGTVPFALGTDTAGSGRVPAAFNGIVGMKPSLGRLSMRGVMPACRSLDCMSVLTADVADAAVVLEAASAYDDADPFSRASPPRLAAPPAPRIAVPHPGQMEFCADGGARRAWERARARAATLGWDVVEIDFAGFAEAARLLYAGPWLAERYAAFGAFLEDHPDDVDPTVRDIVLPGREISAADAFAAMHRLAVLRRATQATWDAADALLLPTTPTIFTPEEIAAEPVARNALLGTYTNFVNLLDLCAIAVPGGAREDGLPFGVTLIAPAGADHALLELGAHWRGEEVARPPTAPAAGSVALAVVGAHLSGEPLNGQLVALGARLRETTRTALGYRLYELPGSEPAKPGLVAGASVAGEGIEVEVWELDAEAFGRFVAAVPPPLVIGTVTLADGSAVKGFLCEAHALDGALEITGFGGWRSYRSTLVP